MQAKSTWAENVELNGLELYIWTGFKSYTEAHTRTNRHRLYILLAQYAMQHEFVYNEPNTYDAVI